MKNKYGQNTPCPSHQSKSCDAHSAAMSSATVKSCEPAKGPSTAPTKQQNFGAKPSNASPRSQRPAPNCDMLSGREKSISQGFAADAEKTQHSTDTIATIQDLLTLNGSAQCATVKLTESTKALIAAAPELLEALRELTLRASISLDYAISGRTETRWTAKDKISPPGTLATHDTMIRAVSQAKAALAKAEGKL